MIANSNIIVMIIVAILVVIALIVLFMKLRKPNREPCPIDLQQLIMALGGKDNIEKTESSPSTLKVTLKDNQVDVDQLKSIGASGVVQGSKTVTMIFGKSSVIIEEYLKEELL